MALIAVLLIIFLVLSYLPTRSDHMTDDPPTDDTPPAEPTEVTAPIGDGPIGPIPSYDDYRH